MEPWCTRQRHDGPHIPHAGRVAPHQCHAGEQYCLSAMSAMRESGVVRWCSVAHQVYLVTLSCPTCRDELVRGTRHTDSTARHSVPCVPHLRSRIMVQQVQRWCWAVSGPEAHPRICRRLHSFVYGAAAQAPARGSTRHTSAQPAKCVTSWND